MKRIAGVLAVALVGFALSGPAAAQVYPSRAQQYGRFVSPTRNFSGLVSGYEAWQLTDIRRRAEIARQVDLNADMYWRWSGAGSFYPGAFEPWPMVPGNVWGWPVGVSPPVVSGTRVPPQFDPEYAQPSASASGVVPPVANPPIETAPILAPPATGSQPGETLPPPPPNFAPTPEPGTTPPAAKKPQAPLPKSPGQKAPVPKPPVPKPPVPKPPVPKPPVPRERPAAEVQRDAAVPSSPLAGPRRF